jgi:hypothetical protein
LHENKAENGGKLAICPLLFSKVARLKPLRPKGLRVFWPVSHFFSSLKCEKKILKNYIK